VAVHLTHKAQIHVTAKSEVLPVVLAVCHHLRMDCILLYSTGRDKGPSFQAYTGLLLQSFAPFCWPFNDQVVPGIRCTFLHSPILLFAFPDLVAAEEGSPMESQHVAFPSEMEKDKDEEEYDDGMPTEVSLISQDETEQVWTLTASSA